MISVINRGGLALKRANKKLNTLIVISILSKYVKLDVVAVRYRLESHLKAPEY
jgi:hypothetical protein